MQVKQLLEQAFPGMRVVGSNYPLSVAQQLASQAVGALQMGGFGLVFFGEKLFEAAGLAAPPGWYGQVAQNKPTAALGVWLVGNMVSSSVGSTGAFEVYFDGRLVFSKLATKRMPTPQDFQVLAQDIADALVKQKETWRQQQMAALAAHSSGAVADAAGGVPLSGSPGAASPAGEAAAR